MTNMRDSRERQPEQAPEGHLLRIGMAYRLLQQCLCGFVIVR